MLQDGADLPPAASCVQPLHTQEQSELAGEGAQDMSAACCEDQPAEQRCLLEAVAYLEADEASTEAPCDLQQDAGQHTRAALSASLFARVAVLHACKNALKFAWRSQPLQRPLPLHSVHVFCMTRAAMLQADGSSQPDKVCRRHPGACSFIIPHLLASACREHTTTATQG